MHQLFGQKPDQSTMMQHWIIGYVSEREENHIDTFQKDIENEFSINRSSTSEMMKLMCKKGLIERVAVDYDARLKKIVLTKKSKEFQQYIDENMMKFHEIMIEGLSKEEIDSFIDISDKIIHNIRQTIK